MNAKILPDCSRPPPPANPAKAGIPGMWKWARFPMIAIGFVVLVSAMPASLAVATAETAETAMAANPAKALPPNQSLDSNAPVTQAEFRMATLIMQGEFREEISDMKAEIKEDIQKLGKTGDTKAELKKDIQNLRDELKREIRKSKMRVLLIVMVVVLFLHVMAFIIRTG